MPKVKLFAQGDVLIIPLPDQDIPAGAAPVPRDPDQAVVLARGETTGHRHAFYGSPHVAMFRDDAMARHIPQDLYLGHVKIAVAEALLKHEEHDTIALPPGLYEIRAQREYHAGEARRVQD